MIDSGRTEERDGALWLKTTEAKTSAFTTTRTA